MPRPSGICRRCGRTRTAPYSSSTVQAGSWLRLLRPGRTAGATGRRVEHIQLPERALKPLAILSGGWQLPQGVHGRRDHAANDGAQRSRHLVVHPHTVTASLYQAAFPQVGKMAGDGRLRQLEAVVNVADADFVVAKEREDAQPRLVRQCLEQVLELVDGRRSPGS